MSAVGFGWPFTNSFIPEIDDPGTGNAIPVTDSFSCAFTIGAGAETNTLADPTFVGQFMILSVNSIGAGSRTVTFSNSMFYDESATAPVFSAIGDYLFCIATQVGLNLRWRVIKKSTLT